MRYLIESILVGVYSLVIYVFVKTVIYNDYLLLFLVGFCKHVFGYLLSIHTLYCNYGDACTKRNKTVQYKKSVYSNVLLIESIMEGIVYVFLGIILGSFITNKIIIYFTIGCALHLISEILQLHYYFCRKRCLVI